MMNFFIPKSANVSNVQWLHLYNTANGGFWMFENKNLGGLTADFWEIVWFGVLSMKVILHAFFFLNFSKGLVERADDNLLAFKDS